ncbi:hypothetical protein LA080_015290 [Diaporthe eres]|nr:hypothetical protein LA080_015290 [Diaporthe eres]
MVIISARRDIGTRLAGSRPPPCAYMGSSAYYQVAHIRSASVRMISDLAKASTPRHDDYGELVNFHHAVSEGALLTEPWTMILIRTFSRAAVILLEGMGLSDVDGNIVSETSVAELRDNSDRCQDCVKALWTFTSPHKDESPYLRFGFISSRADPVAKGLESRFSRWPFRQAVKKHYLASLCANGLPN